MQKHLKSLGIHDLCSKINDYNQHNMWVYIGVNLNYELIFMIMHIVL